MTDVGRDATVARVLEAVLDATSTKTGRNYASHIGRFVRWCEVEGLHPLLVSTEDLERYTSTLEASMTASTIAVHQTGVNAFFRAALRVGVIQRSPMDGLRRVSKVLPTAPMLIPIEQVRQLRAAAATISARHAAVLDLMVMHGLLPSEITGARIENLSTDGTHHWLTIPPTSDPGRTIRLAAPVVGPVLELVGNRRRGPIVRGREGGPIDRAAMVRGLRTAARRAGIAADISPRPLRATFVSIALARGVALDAIRDCLGNTDVRGLDRYVALRGSSADVPRKVAEALVADTESGLLMQARRLLSDDTVHVAAPVVLIGAALEEHLRMLVNREALDYAGEGSINAYAAALLAHGSLTKQEMKGIAFWSGLRNKAAHADLRDLTREDAESMLQGVGALIQRS